MRSTIIYFDRKLTPLLNTQRILDLRDKLFPREVVPRHRATAPPHPLASQLGPRRVLDH